MNLETIRKIFDVNDLLEPQSFRKINVGFTNSVYVVDEKFILKVCDDADNEKPFSLEAKLYDRFKDELPVPQLLAFDASKSVLPNMYLLYPMIEGENLYNVWHTYTDETRKAIIDNYAVCFAMLPKQTPRAWLSSSNLSLAGRGLS